LWLFSVLLLSKSITPFSRNTRSLLHETDNSWPGKFFFYSSPIFLHLNPITPLNRHPLFQEFSSCILLRTTKGDPLSRSRWLPWRFARWESPHSRWDPLPIADFLVPFIAFERVLEWFQPKSNDGTWNPGLTERAGIFQKLFPALHYRELLFLLDTAIREFRKVFLFRQEERSIPKNHFAGNEKTTPRIRFQFRSELFFDENLGHPSARK